MYRLPMIACILAGLLFLTGVWLLPAAVGQTPLRNEVRWVKSEMQTSEGMRRAVKQAAGSTLPLAEPDQVVFVKITSTSPNHRVPVVTFHGWRIHYAAAQIGTAPKAGLTLLLNSETPVADGWPAYGLVAILSDRIEPPLSP